MSTFSTPVVKILDVIEHPNADRLNIVKVLGYTCISNKLEDGSPRYKAGDLAVYIPSASVLPEWLLKKMDFWNSEKNIGGLAGPEGNRVKPLKLRGIFSEGILMKISTDYPNGLPYGSGVVRNDSTNEEQFVNEGDDVSDLLDIIKYEPPIPVHMSGEVFNASDSRPIKYDIESYEKYPTILQEGEDVVVTEKLHGTFTGIAIIPGYHNPEAMTYGVYDTFFDDGRMAYFSNALVYSKGLGAQGLCFKDVENNTSNIYVKAFKSLSLEQRSNFARLATKYNGLHLLGETFGKGVQDLHYGQKSSMFRVFDAYLGAYPFGRYATDSELDDILEKIGVPRVPILARMKYNYDSVVILRDGKDTISNSNVREGIVIRPVIERNDDMIGRVQLKMVSPDYHLRKGITTENQ